MLTRSTWSCEQCNNLSPFGGYTQNTRNLPIQGGEPGYSQNAAVILEENGRISSDFGMGMSKTRGCSYLYHTVVYTKSAFVKRRSLSDGYPERNIHVHWF